MPVLPVALASHLFLESGERWMREFEHKSAVFGLIERLEGEGTGPHPARGPPAQAARVVRR